MYPATAKVLRTPDPAGKSMSTVPDHVSNIWRFLLCSIFLMVTIFLPFDLIYLLVLQCCPIFQRWQVDPWRAIPTRSRSSTPTGAGRTAGAASIPWMARWAIILLDKSIIIFFSLLMLNLHSWLLKYYIDWPFFILMFFYFSYNQTQFYLNKKIIIV